MSNARIRTSTGVDYTAVIETPLLTTEARTDDNKSLTREMVIGNRKKQRLMDSVSNKSRECLLVDLMKTCNYLHLSAMGLKYNSSEHDGSWDGYGDHRKFTLGVLLVELH